MLLVAFWGVATLTSVLIVSNKHAVSQKHLTIVRKYFHGIAVMIFAPGIFYDQHLMYLASSIIFGLFIIVEVRRK